MDICLFGRAILCQAFLHMPGSKMLIIHTAQTCILGQFRVVLCISLYMCMCTSLCHM